MTSSRVRENTDQGCYHRHTLHVRYKDQINMHHFKFGKKSKHSSQPSSSQSSLPLNSKRATVWSGLLSSLPIIEQSLDAVPVPGLKVAIGGLFEILRGLDVCENYPRSFVWLRIEPLRPTTK